MQGRMAGGVASWMKHEGTSSPSSALKSFCSWNVTNSKSWLLRGLIFCLIRFGRSWGGTRLLIQFSFTKPCWLLWGLGPPPLKVLLLFPSSVPSSLVFLCSGTSDLCNTSLLFQQWYRDKTPRWAEQMWQHSSALGVVKHLGSGLPKSSFVSDWACRHFQMANGGNERSFCSSLDVPLPAASTNRINHILF